MTPTRKLIVGFWVALLLIGAWKFYGYNHTMTSTPPAPEKHWFLPAPGSAPAKAPVADVRMTRYARRISSSGTFFTADVTVQNFGQRKATGVQARVQPYVGNRGTNPAAPGPAGIPSFPNGDPMTNIYQWVSFPDLAPGATATQTITLPMRSDADPAQSFKPHVIFQTVNP